MYWMLLPPDANAGRHIDDQRGPQGGFWGMLLHAGWGMVRQFLGAHH